MLNKILAHKKIILAAFLPLIFWAGIFAFWFFNLAEKKESGPLIVASQNNNLGGININQLASLKATMDSDNDGLSDWEESIYGTNPSNPDSDDDGYLDGEEVLSGRDPLKKGPDDLLPNTRLTQNNNSDTRTATEKFVQLAVKNYVQASQAQDLSGASAAELSQLLTQSFGDPNISSQLQETMRSELYYFIPSDLDTKMKTVPDSQKNIQNYMTEIEKLNIAMDDNKPAQDIIDAINTSLSAQNYVIMNGFSEYYQNLYEKTASIAVPSSLANDHKKVAVMFYKYWKVSKAIQEYEKDPLLGVLALNELANLMNQSANS